MTYIRSANYEELRNLSHRKITSLDEVPEAFKENLSKAMDELISKYNVTSIHLTGSLFKGYWSDQTDKEVTRIRLESNKPDRISDVDLYTNPIVKYSNYNVEVLQGPPNEKNSILIWKKKK